jgi:hypothetical protein
MMQLKRVCVTDANNENMYKHHQRRQNTVAYKNIRHIFVMLLVAQLLSAARASGLLDWLNLQPAEQRQPTLSDYTSQGIGLANYFTNSLRRNPIGPPPPALQSRNSIIDAKYDNDMKDPFQIQPVKRLSQV